MANKTNFRSMTKFLKNLISCRIPRMLPHTLIFFILFASLMACDPENNPTTMKGRTITPARLPKVQPMTVPKVPASVREQTAGTNGRSRSPAPAAKPTSSTQSTTQGEQDHDQ